jgi:hypothetical protein
MAAAADFRFRRLPNNSENEACGAYKDVLMQTIHHRAVKKKNDARERVKRTRRNATSICAANAMRCAVQRR